jgi:type I restriction enzyme S subunit
MKQGWEQKTLGDVLGVLRNGINCKQDKNGIGDKISRIESISNANFDIDKVGFTTLSKSDKEKYRLEKGDILFSHINSPIHVGKTALFNSDEEVYHGVNLLLMRPKPFLNGSYFEHYLKFLFQNGYWKGLCKQSVNQASVNQQDINKVEINYPQSLPEQERIVSILDQTFASIAKAKENAQRNLQNAKELFENYLQSVFENNTDDWETMTLGDLATFRNGMNFTKSSKGEKIKIVGVKDFQNSFLVPFNDLESVTIDGSLNEIDYLKEGDIIAVRSNGNPVLIGRTLLAGKVSGKVSHSGFTIRIRLNSEIILPVYLCHYLKTQKTRKELVDSGNGVGIKSLNQGSLSSLLIPFPKSIKDQEKIINNIEALSSETKKLEAIYQQKLLNLEELKKSILHKAFNGEL